MHVFGGQNLSQFQHTLTVALAIVNRVRQGLGNRHPMQDVKNLCQHAIPVWPLLGQLTHRLEQAPRIALQQGMQHAVNLTVIEGTQHGAHIGSQHLAFTEGNSLISQAHGVTHRTVGGATEQPQRIVLEWYVFSAQYMVQVFDHPLRRHILQRELQATRENGYRQLLRIGGSQ